MNPLWHGLLGFFMCVMGFISVTGNGMVVYIFTTTKVINKYMVKIDLLFTQGFTNSYI